MADAVRDRNSEEESLDVEPEGEELVLACEEEASGAFRFLPLEDGR